MRYVPVDETENYMVLCDDEKGRRSKRRKKMKRDDEQARCQVS